MFSFTEKIEVKTELPAPDRITMTYRDDKTIKSLPQFINIGQYCYRVVRFDIEQRSTCFGLGYRELTVELELVRMAKV